uniref:Steroid 5-alpha-reductase DET2 n=1 Tax=Chlamydomonas leiostraca TaxID=1034604 RepID=A0A7S0RAJ9_9CHLO|mmetsp:Transcript_1794/g.4682  ORF Transcript_1794/g.4682 Transcript_1794/m.4682 type:complete len:256 (+) Transcript_1794:151-918(+)
MNDVEAHQLAAWTMLLSGIPVFIALLFLSAPYGRYSRGGWGPLINAKIAWFTQEVPSLLVAGAILASSGVPTFTTHPASLRTALAVMFLAHYVYRSLVYPFRMKSGNHTPLSIWAMSFVFCIWNGFLQGYFIAYQLPHAAPVSTQAAIGLLIQAVGWLNVMYADTILLNLRKPGETGYQIPYGGMFTLVSAGNYASEIIEWAGYALAAGGALPAAAFAFFVFCNLAPRGWQHHQWYQKKFSNYPANRKAVIPFIW